MSTRRLRSVLLPLVLLCAALAPRAQEAPGLLPYDVHVDDLDNGLRLVTVPTDFPDIVSVQIVVATGSRNEVEEGRSGFAHFFEHMMFRGTKNFTPEQQNAVFKQAGADRNAFTTDDYTCYHTTFAKGHLEQVLALEADRFQNLEYALEAFQTEARAVLGEYNKNSSNPITKLFEEIRDAAFVEHTYKHTTMGFLRDIARMPRMYDYSKAFFDRWYRPEYTTILVVGDVDHARVREMVERRWGNWERGSHTVEIPAEPAQEKPVRVHVKWPAPTRPWVVVAHKGPAFSTTRKDMVTMDVIASLGFSSTSDLYRRLYLEEQKVDSLFAYFPDRKDPGLLYVMARVKDPADVWYVRDRLVEACESFKTEPVDEAGLERVKSRLRYSFLNDLDSSEAIAESLVGYLGLTRDPRTVDSVYGLYDDVTPADVQAMARRYFVENARTTATLSHEELPADPRVAEASTGGEAATPDSAVLLPSRSPLVSFRLVYPTGSRFDPSGREGLAQLTARMIATGATQRRSYREILDALFPMAASIDFQVDKEMTVFSGTVHVDNVAAFRDILLEMLTEPAFLEEDLARAKSDTLAALDTGIRRSDDEELGKEVLYNLLYDGHEYRHHSLGTLAGIEAITLDDIKAFHRDHYRDPTRPVTIGLAGGYPAGLPAQLAGALVPPTGDRALGGLPTPPVGPGEIERNRMTIVQKQTRATGIHVGFPIEVTRGHPDWVALWLVRSYLGEHRSENSYLYQRLREIRGLNYGDYAYIEYFPGGGGQFMPPPNLARHGQIFQIWIRPVQPENGPFTLKATYFELRKLVEEGIPEAAFEATRAYLSKYCKLLVATQDRQLGYAIDSAWYGTSPFVRHVEQGLAALTLEQVNAALRRHLRADRLQFVVVTEDAEGFRDAILGDAPTPVSYTTKPGEEILAEDAVIEALRIPLRREDVTILPIDRVFAR